MICHVPGRPLLDDPVAPQHGEVPAFLAQPRAEAAMMARTRSRPREAAMPLSVSAPSRGARTLLTTKLHDDFLSIGMTVDRAKAPTPRSAPRTLSFAICC